MISAGLAVQAALARLVGAALGAAHPGEKAGGRGDGGPIELARVRRVLVVRPDEIGDVVLTTAFLRELRRALPAAHVTLVVKPEARALVALCPHVDEVITYAVAVRKWLRPVVLPARAFRLAARRLRATPPDLAILPRWDGDQCYATFVAFWSGARWRLGHSEHVTEYKRTINRGFDRLLTHTVNDPGIEPEALKTLHLVRALGHEPADDRLELWTSADDDRAADALLAAAGVAPHEELIALCPSPGHSRLKQWPVEHFAELARRLAARPGTRLVVIGSGQDAALGRAIADAAGEAVVDATGRTSLRETVALLRRARLCVSNDTGPMHMAAAAQTPVVALFGASDYRRYQPWRGHSLVTLDLACSPAVRGGTDDRCRRCVFAEPRCMTEMSVARVLRAVLDVLARDEGPPGDATPSTNASALTGARPVPAKRDSAESACAGGPRHRSRDG